VERLELAALDGHLEGDVDVLRERLRGLDGGQSVLAPPAALAVEDVRVADEQPVEIDHG
jgi:hypothetical protein